MVCRPIRGTCISVIKIILQSSSGKTCTELNYLHHYLNISPLANINKNLCLKLYFV